MREAVAALVSVIGIPIGMAMIAAAHDQPAGQAPPVVPKPVQTIRVTPSPAPPVVPKPVQTVPITVINQGCPEGYLLTRRDTGEATCASRLLPPTK